ncbi:MAG: hypothetical protein ILN61_11150 [Lachnospiraceae bacterium]|nr:hypothetical protein [Lachnospiraceae bacterium]
MEAIKEYDAKIDAKKRITLRGSSYEYYHVIEFPNGRIELEPRVLVEPFEIDENTLKMIDKSMENLKKGIASEPIDLTEFAD